MGSRQWFRSSDDADEQRPLHPPPIPSYTDSPPLVPHLQPTTSSSSAYTHNPDNLFRGPSSAGGGFYTAGDYGIGSYQQYPQQQLLPPPPVPDYDRDPPSRDGRRPLRDGTVVVVEEEPPTCHGLFVQFVQPRAADRDGQRGQHFPFFLLVASIAQCVVMGVAIGRNGGFAPFSVNPFFGPSVQMLIDMGAKDVPLIVEDYQVWRFFTAIFLHAGLIHLALNLLFQLQVAMLERQMGFLRIAFVYVVSGFAGNLVSSLFLPRVISVGASGALFGLVGMFIVVILRNWSVVISPCRNLVLLCFMVIISLGVGLLPDVDNFAHTGGLVAGVLAGLIVVPSMKSGDRVGPCRLSVTSLALLALPLALGLGVYALFEDVPLREWCSFCTFINCVDFGQDWCDGLDSYT